jgi:hypothetical protein
MWWVESNFIWGADQAISIKKAENEKDYDVPMEGCKDRVSAFTQIDDQTMWLRSRKVQLTAMQRSNGLGSDAKKKEAGGKPNKSKETLDAA